MHSQLISQAIFRMNLSETHARKAVTTDCGVYVLLHRASGKIYIGSAAGRYGIRQRMSNHRSELRKNSHGNRHLQNYVNTYGLGSFDLLIIEITDTETTRERERHYISLHKPWKHGFNMVQAVDDLWVMSEVQRAHVAHKASKPFTVMFNDEVFSGSNLTEFCRLRGLHQGAMTQVVLGKKIQFKGWTLPGNSKPPRLCKYWPTGELRSIPYYEGTKFAKSMGLNAAAFNAMLRGSTNLYRGWALQGATVTSEELAFSMLPMAEKRRINGRNYVGPKVPPRYHRSNQPARLQ